MSIKTISHAKSSSELRGLTPILNEWITLVERYSTNNPNDACYWYNERASLSVRAAAAWQASDWVALEEYATQKRSGFRHSETGKVLRRAGRCDLYLASKNGNSQFAVEAKQAWQRIGCRVSAPYDKIVSTAESAWTDAGRLMRNEANHRLAATFCVPSLPKSVLAAHQRRGESMDDVITSWIDKLGDSVTHDAIAYVFPKKCRGLMLDNGRVYPGVALILRKRHRAARAIHHNDIN